MSIGVKRALVWAVRGSGQEIEVTFICGIFIGQKSCLTMQDTIIREIRSLRDTMTNASYITFPVVSLVVCWNFALRGQSTATFSHCPTHPTRD
ncbi:Zinc finger BED domain-containing protein RICESLEEPER 4 [Fusarium oxysporum f. sp. albedinis]|nr:Zinc finger BED domain-containing protein RICESLEEPER 4 [Fusarium oxysporum f. sp. albedinis]